jgi:hypothetical protein
MSVVTLKADIRTASLVAPVFVAGKRYFEARDKRAEKASEI